MYGRECDACVLACCARATYAMAIDGIQSTPTNSPDKALRCYAMAALANSAMHPLLAGRLRELDGVAVITKVEGETDRQTRGLALGGTCVMQCAEAALVRLGEERTGRGGATEGGGHAAAAMGSPLGLGSRRWTFKCVSFRLDPTRSVCPSNNGRDPYSPTPHSHHPVTSRTGGASSPCSS